MNQKKIVFLTQYYLPELGAPPARISELAAGLVKKGFNISIVTAVPNRPKGNIHKGFEKKWRYISNENGINVFRVKVLLPKLFGNFINRLITELSFSLNAVIFAFHPLKSADIIIIQNPPLFSGLLTPLFKIIFKSKVINWCSDVWPELHLELGTFRETSLITKFMRLIQKINFYFSDSIAVTTHNTVKQIKGNYGKENVLLWPNGVDTDFFKPEETEKSLQKKFQLDESSFLVGYAGLHGNFQNLHVVIDSMKILNDENISFILVGDGAQKKEIIKRTDDENIKRVHFLEPQKKEDMPSLLQNFDALFIPLAKAMPSTIPSKFYESIAAGKPLIVVNGSEISDIVKTNNLGELYDCNNATSLAKALKKMSQKSQLELLEIGKRSRIYSKKFDRKILVENISKDIKKLL